METKLMDTRAPSSPTWLPKSGSKSDHGLSTASPSSSSSFAAAAVAIFLRHNSSREAITKKVTVTAKKKLSCCYMPPPLAIRCHLHQFGSWPFRNLAAAPSALFSGCQCLGRKEVVLRVVTSSNSAAFTNCLRRRGLKKQPTRFSFEHHAKARVASEASGPRL